MFNNIILKVSILSFMTGIRHTDVRGISSGNPVCPPPVTCGDSPVGACGSGAALKGLPTYAVSRTGHTWKRPGQELREPGYGTTFKDSKKSYRTRKSGHFFDRPDFYAIFA